MVRWGNEDNIAIGDDDVALDYLLEGRTRKEMRTKLDQAKIILATLNAFGGLNFGEEVVCRYLFFIKIYRYRSKIPKTIQFAPANGSQQSNNAYLL